MLDTHCRAALMKQVSLNHILLPVELKEVETPSRVLGDGPGVGDTLPGSNHEPGGANPQHLGIHTLLPVELNEVETPSKVLGEGPGVGHTLQGSTHKTGVANP